MAGGGRVRIVIAGAGKLGYKLAEALSRDDHDITVVDIDEQALSRVSSNLDVLTIRGNAVSMEVLQQLGLERTHIIIAVTASDEANILIGMMAKKLGCEKAVARIRTPEYADQINFFRSELGIDFITNPDRELAHAAARYLIQEGTVHMEQFAQGRVGLLERSMADLPHLVGRALSEVRDFQSLLVAAISRDGQILIPSGRTVLTEGDVLYLIGRGEDLRAFAGDELRLAERRIPRRVMILGGGNAALYLAQRLREYRSQVKIIEQDEERCAYLVERLPNVLVIHGDGTDHDLLDEENLAEMDALVALTGLDEENLLLALLGKRLGVAKVAAKVSRSNFIHIIEQLGIDLAVNPVLLSAASIIRFIEGGQIASLSLLFGGQAEVLEIIVTEASKVIGIPLKDLNLPEGIIVGAIIHAGKIIIPKGDSVIRSGDRVVVFCVTSLVSQLEKLFYRQKGGFLREFWRGHKGPGNPPTD